MRRYFIFFISLLAFCGSLSTIGVTINARNYELRGYVDPTQVTNLPYRNEQRLGVNADLEQYSPSELSNQLALMQQAGFYWVRQFVYWDEIEPEQGIYNWQSWDTIADEFRKNPNLELVVVFFQSPPWSRKSSSITAPPNDIQNFAQFATAFATRYGDIVHAYQIWDEPNLDDAWGDAEPRVADYAALLQAGYDAIHSTDPNATVLTAALAPTTEVSGRNISDWRFLEQLYTFGAQAYSDGVAAKPYGFNASAADRTVSEDRLNFSRIVRLREIMVQHDDGHKPLWASEWGWHSTPSNWQGSPSIWGTVTQQEQINFTIEAYKRAEREWPWLGGMILQTWQPVAEERNPIWGYSLLTPSGESTNLLTAIQSLETPPGATNGLYHPATSFATYSGLWTFGPLGADIGWLETSDSHLSFNFWGRSVALWVRKSNVSAFLYTKVDNNPGNALPQDNQGNSYIFLRSASLEPETNLVVVADELSLGEHKLNAVADRGWDRWALAGYAVSSGNLNEPYNRQIAIAGFTSIIAIIATIVSAFNLPWRGIAHRCKKLTRTLNTTSETFLAAFASLILTFSMLLTWTESGALIFRREAVQFGIGVVLTGGLIAFQPGFILTTLAIAVLFILFLRNLNTAIILIIFYAPFYAFPVELYSFAFPIAEVLTLIAFTAWLIRQLISWAQTYQITPSQYRRDAIRYLRHHLTPLDYGVISWVLMGMITLIWTQYKSYAITEWRVLFIEPALFYLLLRSCGKALLQRKQWSYTLVLSGTLVAGISLIQFVLGDAIITAEDGTWRLAGIYGSPNNLALFLVRCLPFALSVWFVIKTPKWKPLVGTSILLILGSIAFTQSVAAYLISVPVTIIVVLLLNFGRKALIPITLIIIAGIIGFAILSGLSPRFASLLDWSQGTNFLRIRVWESALDIITDYPITGIGLDQFLYVFRSHYIRPDAIWDPDLSHPHNFVLDVWLRLSIFGLFIFLWIQKHFWSNISKNMLVAEQSTRWLYIGTAASMAGLLAHGLVDNSIFVTDLAYVFMLLLALSYTNPNIHAIDAPEKQ